MTSTANNTNGKRPAAFRDAVTADMNAPATMRLGENGCPEFTDAGLGSRILALSQMVRGGKPGKLCDDILSNNDPSMRDVLDLIVLTFVTRNARGGKGEKDLSFEMFLRVWNHYPETAKKLLRLFPHYGYWKDMLLLNKMAVSGAYSEALKEALMEETIDLIRQQFEKDLEAVAQYERALVAADEEGALQLKKRGPKISLLAKWLPREGSRFDKKLDFVNRFTQATPPTAMESSDEKVWKSKHKAVYRKTAAKLTAFLELPEVLLSAQRADEINFYKLASKATFRLSRALLNERVDGEGLRSEDPKRIRLAKLFVKHMTQEGLKGAQLMPHEIVKEILRNSSISSTREKVLDAQWKSLWKSVVDQVKAKAKEEGLEFNPTEMVPLSDVSGSMDGVPMLVSIALGIGISEITHPAFQNMVLTFETSPRWHKLNAGDSIVKKVQSLARAPWGGSTNFFGAYSLILETCRKHRLAREDVPSLIVFSDMQFNYADSKCTTMHNNIRSAFTETANELGWEDKDPTPIVYWNLRSTGGHPVEKDTEGAVLLSAFSPSLLKLVMNGEALKEEEVEIVELDGTVRKEKVRVTPEEVLRKMLNDSLYDPVRAILAESSEGVLGDYEPDGVAVEATAEPGELELL